MLPSEESDHVQRISNLFWLKALNIEDVSIDDGWNISKQLFCILSFVNLFWAIKMRHVRIQNTW